MWYWIIKVSILSFILIFLLHYLYSFFISTLTVPKVKDLVTLPQQKYDEMFHSLQQQQQQQQQQQLLNININNNGNNNATGNSQSMKDDLINFLKDIGSSSTSNTNMNENSNNLEYLPMNANTISSYSFNNN
jgi:hypothetical protein